MHSSSLILDSHDSIYLLFFVGTLGDCSAALTNWCQRMSTCIYEECERCFLDTDKVLKAFYEAIGWNMTDNNLMPSALLSRGTWTEILDATIGCLQVFGVMDAAQKVQYWHDNLGDIHANDKPLIPDLPRFVEYFRQLGIIVAICTSDDRRATDSCIRNWNLENLIDVSIVGLLTLVTCSSYFVSSFIPHLLVALQTIIVINMRGRSIGKQTILLSSPGSMQASGCISS